MYTTLLIYTLGGCDYGVQISWQPIATGRVAVSTGWIPLIFIGEEIIRRFSFAPQHKLYSLVLYETHATTFGNFPAASEKFSIHLNDIAVDPCTRRHIFFSCLYLSENMRIHALLAKQNGILRMPIAWYARTSNFYCIYLFQLRNIIHSSSSFAFFFTTLFLKFRTAGLLCMHDCFVTAHLGFSRFLFITYYFVFSMLCARPC